MTEHYQQIVFDFIRSHQPIHIFEMSLCGLRKQVISRCIMDLKDRDFIMETEIGWCVKN